jgi:hypothetical protein
MTTLQKIVTAAKALKKKYPNKYSKWTDYVKAASKTVKPTTKKVGAAPKKKKAAAPKKKAAPRSTHKDTKSHNVNIKVVSGLGQYFDTSVIKDIDALKKQYFKLAKKYHPDAGGTTAQFQQLQSEYEKLLNALLKGSNFTQEQKDNEIELDKAMRAVIDALVGLEGINVELIGKWLWISGNTYPVRTQLKSAGLIFFKKDGVPYWVYKGVESKSRGGTTMDEIKQKYGAKKIDVTPQKKLSGIGSISPAQKVRLKTQLKRVIRALNKRPI